MRAEFKEAFELFDTDKSGSIDASELSFTMRALGFEPTGQEVADMLAKTDEDGNGTVSYEEFEDLISGKLVTSSPTPLHTSIHTLRTLHKRGEAARESAEGKWVGRRLRSRSAACVEAVELPNPSLTQRHLPSPHLVHTDVQCA